MAARFNPQGWLRESKKSWLLLANGAIWLFGIIGSFLLPPPVGLAQQKVWVRFAQFILAIVLGLVLLAGHKFKLQKHAFRWAGLSVVCLFLACATFFLFQYLSDSWTCVCDQQRVLIGSVLTPLAKSYLAENPSKGCEELIKDNAGGVLEDLWTRESINRRRLGLASVYVLSMPLFTMCILSLVQAMHCFSGQLIRRKKRARSSAAKRSA